MSVGNYGAGKSGSQHRGIPVPSDDGTRTIGTIRDRTFRKSNFQSTKHVCRKYRGIGLDKGAFENLIEPLAELIVLADRDTSRTLTIGVADFVKHAIEDDLGSGLQLFCPLKWFEVEDADPNKPKQLAMSFA